MAEIANLRHARKQKTRAEKEQRAAANRAKFGQTKTEKKRESLTSSKERRDLDGAKLTDNR